MAVTTISYTEGLRTVGAMPAGWASKDLILLHLFGITNNVATEGYMTFTVGSGYNLIRSRQWTTQGQGITDELWYDIAASGEISPSVVASGGTNQWISVLSAYRGVNITNPIGTVGTSGFGSTQDPGTILPEIDGFGTTIVSTSAPLAGIHGYHMIINASNDEGLMSIIVNINDNKAQINYDPASTSFYNFDTGDGLNRTIAFAHRLGPLAPRVIYPFDDSVIRNEAFDTDQDFYDRVASNDPENV